MRNFPANTENFSVSIPEKGTGSVERIVIGSKNYTEDFSYSGGVLTIANSLMQTVSSGERQLRVYFEKENDADREKTAARPSVSKTKTPKCP